MKIILSNVSNQPLYQQIKEQIKESIFNNELKEGEQLPSIRLLANDLHVSVLTTKRVYAELEAEGFIITRVGKGTYVAPTNLELLMESKRHMVEVKLAEVCQMARSIGIHADDLHSMMDLILEEEESGK
ncbi:MULTISPECIES: GntR family transcriptional regulator [Bacillus]|uniref:GntR family transcriptional regulator n=1 Tax=Bacillus thuringiensis serovar vazensis TaxID=180867 RepID=A0A243D339_BACTU|nr:MULTISPECIES: GntR family transcriptional regulator [Bacillus]EEM90107.1 Transcriptional regulator, GntR [Bacillus thuringiensis serovar pulsiensis BGSC 4CC1]MCU5689234.1 GntR family transcriptional regulator [Bacillus cereus]MEB9905891.1 GntR family transcriptional regulator [Bacillus anthracis]MEC0901125.1 GntR family transcriptional regulator [Bacillus anthracis]MEC1953559.1 GntR family transcriptional regulator [Bacillus anthracis]